MVLRIISIQIFDSIFTIKGYMALGVIAFKNNCIYIIYLKNSYPVEVALTYKYLTFNYFVITEITKYYKTNMLINQD